jgi:hypothetical protein
MVLDVFLFIDGIHFGVAVQAADGWYKFEYASGGASGLSGSSHSGGSSGKTSNAVTIKRSAPTGKVQPLGQTRQGLDAIIDFARVGSGFHNSDYGVMDNNCRQFAAGVCDFMGLGKAYDAAAAGFFATR